MAEIRDVSERLTGRLDVARRGVLVCGLGRFGSALACTLEEMGIRVLGVDADERVVQDHADRLTHVVQADTTDARALRSLGAPDFASGVVAIGTDLEASILTAVGLVDSGVGALWAKAASAAHGRILERVGVTNVVYPERDMGLRVAHLVTGRMLEYLEIDEGFSLVATVAPRALVGRTVAEAGVRAHHQVTVVCIKHAGEPFTYVTADTMIHEGDVLLVAGSTERAERFAALR